MSGSTGITGHAARYTFRTLAVVMLLLGLAGATNVTSSHVDRQQHLEASTEAGTSAYQLEMVELQRLVDANERPDRSRRTAPGSAGPERVSRAAEVEIKPAPEPSPTRESAPSEPAGPVPGSCSSYSGNRATGCSLLLDAGFSIDQMSCLANLWTRESGWNHRAQNPSSGAYGIPQALPGDKMASHGDDWRTNPATQIRWGLDYIRNRYGTPCGAWQFFQNNNWY